MAELKNSRHELFVQGVVTGKSATQAYIDAGYSETGADRSASRLLGNVEVSARVNELKAEAAKGTVLTVERLTTDLLRLAKKGEDLGEASGLSVARASIMDVAKLNGLIVDQSKSEVTAKVQGISAREILAGKLAALAARSRAARCTGSND